jgi:hypothetical protein
MFFKNNVAIKFGADCVTHRYRRDRRDRDQNLVTASHDKFLMQPYKTAVF